MHPKTIISLTSYPERIEPVSKVIKSLFQQSIKADEIILWLSQDEFPERENNLPESLISMLGKNGFWICWVPKNLKSHKKYFYALQEYPDDIVITVDDDMYYSSQLVEELLCIYQKYPDSIAARGIRIMLKNESGIADYTLWNTECEKYREQKRMDLCAIGCYGILYPPHIANERWFDVSTMMNLSPNQDDLWLKYNEILDGVSVVYGGNKNLDKIVEESQKCALFKMNVGENQNNRCIEQLYSWCKIKNKETAEEWLEGLHDAALYYKLYWEKAAFDLKRLLDENQEKEIYICGAGKFAKTLIRLFQYCHKQERISALLVSNHSGNSEMIEGIPVLLISDIKVGMNQLILCGVSQKNRQELKDKFEKANHWIDLNLSEIYFYSQYFYSIL